jgi:hypothetical protein
MRAGGAGDMGEQLRIQFQGHVPGVDLFDATMFGGH